MADNLLSSFLPDDRASFGIFPQMKPRRRVQDPTGAANVPLDVTRGRVAGLAGLLPDVLNFMGRSPMPTEQFGETQYEPAQQLPYGSEYFLQNLPLKPTSRIGEVAGQAGAFVPLNPMPAARAVAAGVKALGPTAVRMGEGYLQSKGLMPGVVEGGAIPGSYEGSSVLMNPKNLTPLNKIEDANKYKSILNSMQEFGYQGRPILAYMDNGQAKALTGSHRLYAARNAGIDVPVVFVKPSVMKWEDNEGLFGTFKESINDQRVYEHLKAAGDDTAASLAKLEDQIYQPTGMLGGPIKPQAPVSELGFYSATEQAALNLPRKSGTGESFLNDLMKGQDVKKDELSWMGLDDYLKGKPNVTRQEVQDFISNNRVDVREVKLGGNEAPSQDLLSWMSARSILPPRNPEGWQELSQKLERYAQQHQKAQGTPEASQRYFTLSEEAGRISEGLNAGGSSAGATKYQQYQLPGGENYREILLTLPNQWDKPRAAQIANEAKIKALRQEMYGTSGTNEIRSEISRLQNENTALQKQISEAPIYTSSHFSNQPNILAHMRVNDRVDADGKKMLLIEEIQSDWHQAGRETGYKTGKERNPAQVEKELTITTQKRSRLLEEAAALPDSEMTKFKAMNEEIKALGEQATKLNEEWTDLLMEPTRVPDAPFKDTWHQLALKRALKYAADNGYDRVGLTTGRQQVDRYTNEMRQNVDEIQFQTGQKLTDIEAAELKALRQKTFRDMTGTERAKFDVLSSQEGSSIRPDEIKIKAYKGRSNTFDGKVKNGKFIEGPAQGKTVEEVLGKSMAKQIAEKKDGVIKGDDLTIGGEGMKAYYDEIYPAFLAKQGKKYNAKTGETIINSGKVQSKDELAAQVYGRGMTYRNLPSEQKRKIDEMGFGKGAQSIRYIDISPEMRGGVKKGQPLFTAAPIGGIGLGAGTQDKQQNSINSFIQ